eukprot:gene26226-biopygen15055
MSRGGCSRPESSWNRNNRSFLVANCHEDEGDYFDWWVCSHIL